LYTNIVENSKALVFLGTPHRGSGLAELLSNLLSVMFSRKIFVDQLRINSEMIQEINDAFQDRSQHFHLISYYESNAMHSGLVHSFISTKSNFQVIVPKSFAILGVPGEKVSALNGNHQEISKFRSKDDDNYIRVAGNLSKLAGTLTAPNQNSNIEAT
jgi:hypothetical protein